LVGRDRDAEDVAKVLARSSILTLVGPPGVGKSRLAADVARRLHGSGSATVVMVDLGRATDAIAVTTLVARAIGANRLSEPADEDPTAAEGVVVVLDDCDRVAPAAAVAEALVDGGVRVLATGRRPLGADGEAVWRVPPLRLPQPGHDELPDVFIDSEAVQLFCDRAASADRGFIPISDNAEAIAEICRHLDGLPLAIELAARAVAAYSPAQIAARLGGSLSFLTRGYCTADPRHHSLEASLAWSWEMLSGPEQALLRRLSVFSGTFSDEAAAAVCVGAEVAAAKVFGLLGSLVDKSVLETVTVAGRTRYRLLHVIRLYGHGRLGSFGTELDELTARHCQYYLTAVESEGGPDTEGSRFIERLEDDHDNVGSALEWAMAADRAVDALRLGSAYVCLCWARGDHGRARSWLQRLALVAGEAPAELRSAARRAAGDRRRDRPACTRRRAAAVRPR